MSILSNIEASLTSKRDNNLLRERVCVEPRSATTLVVDGQSFINFSSNDYLGLASISPGTMTSQFGAMASPLVVGYQPVHQQLEQALCTLLNYDAAMLFCSGFAANHALLTALAPQAELVIADKQIHASMVDGVQASGSRLRRFVHNDVHRAQTLLAQNPNALLLCESVYSMDGDLAPLAQLCDSAKQHGGLSVVDDAHGFGVIGRNGLGAREFCQPDILVITFGKALGAQGAAILASDTVIQYLQNSARHYIYSTAISPLMAELALSRLDHIRGGEQHRKLWHNIELFESLARKNGLNIGQLESPIVPIHCQSSEQALAICEQLKKEGIWLTAIRPPTVATPRLRLTLTAAHTQQQLTTLVNALTRLSESNNE